jgi:diguanylate cyclase (GGDEF)-like protein/PAS domain S-box-containing protein
MQLLFHFLHHDHVIALVGLAAAISIVTAMSTILLLRLTKDSQRADRWRWLTTAALVSGFGIWATHFVAMLGYDTGMTMAYAVVPTVGSLLLAILGNGAAITLSLRYDNVKGRMAAATIIGCSIGAMHYLGMAAVQMAGAFLWNYQLVALSVLLGILPAYPALVLSLNRSGLFSGMAAGLLVVTCTVALHFTGMAAFTVIPLPGAVASNLLLSPSAMAGAITATAFAVMTIAVTAATVSMRARIALRDSERDFKILIQGINDCALYMVGPDGRIASWNKGAQSLKGYSAEEALGMPLAMLYRHEDQISGQPAKDMELARLQGNMHREAWCQRKDGSLYWAHITLESVYDSRGRLRGYAQISRNMTQFKADQDRLAALTANLDAALSHMQQGLCLYTADEKLVLFNPRISKIFGITHETCPAGTTLSVMLRQALELRANGPVSDAAFAEALARHRALMAKPEGGTMIVPFLSDYTLSITYSPTNNNGWVVTFDDITERREAERRIQHMALHDGLTGLANRIRYIQRLDLGIQEADIKQANVAVINIDLDRFKEVNDVHGHAVGDLVLVALSHRMSAAIQADECVARFGGDEFAAMKIYEHPDELNDFISRLENCFKSPIEIDDISISAAASLGVAIYPSDGDDQEKVLNNADLAMYRAKESVDRNTCYYEQGMDEAARARRQLAADLREALRRDEFKLAYQVQRLVQTGEITGYEALLRWEHAKNGWVSPEIFIPVAEESGVILALGEWVLRTACAEAATWAEPWRVAVNLSPIQLMHVDLLNIVRSALEDSGLSADRLELEITETAIITDKSRALHILRGIKALGVTIAIDDFGTGYSSLDTLNSFPFDKIKIDKSFLLGSGDSRQARAIIRAVLALGKSLEVPVLAEGLETEEQLLLLQSEGCDQAQGYLWGRPSSVSDPSTAPRKMEVVG